MLKNRALSFKIWESLQPGMRIPNQVIVSDEDIEDIKKVKWTDLDWEQIGDDGNTIIWLKMVQPFTDEISNGVIVDIQLIQDTFYQIHINIAENLRGIGLGTKIYRSIIEWAGHLYSGKGRRHNPIINDVWDNLKSESGVTCASNELGDICVSNLNPKGDELLNIFNSI
jgi:hypothetical protein